MNRFNKKRSNGITEITFKKLTKNKGNSIDAAIKEVKTLPTEKLLHLTMFILRIFCIVQ